MGTLKPQSNRPLYSNTVIGTLAVDGWYSEEEPGRAVAGDVNFMKYFKNFTIFSGFTLTRLTFLYVKHYLLFIYARAVNSDLCTLQLSNPICRPTCLVCLFKYGQKLRAVERFL